nr:Nonstructural protein NS2A [dengue virus type 3]
GSGKVDNFTMGVLCLAILFEEVLRGKFGKKHMIAGVFFTFVLLLSGQITWRDMAHTLIMIGSNASDRMGMGVTYLALIATFKIQPFLALGFFLRKLTSRENLLLGVGLAMATTLQLPEDIEQMANGVALGLMALKLITQFETYQLWTALVSLTCSNTIFTLTVAWRTATLILAGVSLLPVCQSSSMRKTDWLPMTVAAMGVPPLPLFIFSLKDTLKRR